MYIILIVNSTFGISHSCSDRLIEVTWQSSLPSVVNELRVGSLTVGFSGVYSSSKASISFVPLLSKQEIISIIVWCCLVHPNMGQTLIIRCKVSRAIAITSYCELWQARKQQPGRIGISWLLFSCLP
jgi:hypothetical protein